VSSDHVRGVLRDGPLAP